MNSGLRPSVVVYTTAWCPYCARVKRLFADKGVRFTEIDIEAVDGARAEMRTRSGRSSVPQVFIGDRHIGGCDDTQALDREGKLDPLLGLNVTN
jgi:glutaredoxin 3